MGVGSFKTLVVLAGIFAFGFLWNLLNTEKPKELNSGTITEKSPPSLALYYYLEKYSEEYGVPFHIAMGVAREETGYKGPFQWKYNPRLTSSAAAYGAMQIQVPTANFIWDEPVTKKQLLNDLELNVQISMKLLAYLHKRYGSWLVALGCYNTGRPLINSYARNIVK
jgi:soluble lytic murein transglycosylase-like protein